MSAKAEISGSVVAGFPSPAEQYLKPLGSRFARRVRFPMGREPPQGAITLDLNEFLIKRPAATYFVDALNAKYGKGKETPAKRGHSPKAVLSVTKM